MRLTREEALNRVIDTYVSAPEGDKISHIADLLLSVQAETVEKCCEIAKLHDESTATGGECAVDISIAIRAAFPGEVAK